VTLRLFQQSIVTRSGVEKPARLVMYLVRSFVLASNSYLAAYTRFMFMGSRLAVASHSILEEDFPDVKAPSKRAVISAAHMAAIFGTVTRVRAGIWEERLKQEMIVAHGGTSSHMAR